jgi:DNA mismatch endonuclease (patch repair protein)
MRAVKDRDTAPEMTVRRLVHGMGYRYRLHGKDLPGKPDLLFRPKKKAIFVHGCFWHGHSCKRGDRRPKSNTAYWSAKLNRNMTRDKRNLDDLRRLGWRALVVWECETKDLNRTRRKISRFLKG